MSFQFDSARIKKRIAEALAKTYNQADPKLLNQSRSVFTKEVSFFRRSYFTAYLLMEMDQGGEGKSGGFREKYSRKFQKPVQDGDEESGRPENRKALPENESVKLFISAGRSRRVFPREILGLIASKTPVSKDDIGAIRILDNYSFIQVRTAAADAIIEALNGKSFRGRSLVVNYARSRKDEAPAAEKQPDDGGLSGLYAGDAEVFPEDSESAGAETAGDEYQEEAFAREEDEEDVDASSVQEEDDQSDKEGI
jgi:hypothetical protein